MTDFVLATRRWRWSRRADRVGAASVPPDARTLVAKVLAALATCDDKLPKKLLDDHFSSDDDDGNYIWPREPDDIW